VRSSITFDAIPHGYPPHRVREADKDRDGNEYTGYIFNCAHSDIA
jgi:hypothetical protein